LRNCWKNKAGAEPWCRRAEGGKNNESVPARLLPLLDADHTPATVQPRHGPTAREVEGACRTQAPGALLRCICVASGAGVARRGTAGEVEARERKGLRVQFRVQRETAPPFQSTKTHTTRCVCHSCAATTPLCIVRRSLVVGPLDPSRARKANLVTAQGVLSFCAPSSKLRLAKASSFTLHRLPGGGRS
jgi:hypothetical protein